MKKLNTFVFVASCLLVVVFLLASSCDKMNDIQEEYASREEAVYLGRADSVKAFSGFESVKLTWYLTADPKVQRTVVYWNGRQDSIVKELDRKGPGSIKDSIIINGLPEGTVRFELRNENDLGETSLFSEVSATVWGLDFASGLHSRRIVGFDYDYAASKYTLVLTPSAPGDDVVFGEIKYKDNQEVEKTVIIDREADSVVLGDFPDGGSFSFRTVFFLPKGIDTVYADFQEFAAPAAVSQRGVKLALKGSTDNQYFDRRGATTNDADTLYEWNIDGDLNIYTFTDDGALSLDRTESAAVSRDEYTYLFFYDADRFIGINPSNRVYLLQENGGHFDIIETPGGKAYMGSGFKFENYMPGRGFFYSLTPGDGALKTWFANNDATWDSPNGATVGTDFTAYSPLILFNRQTLLGVDAEGYLWSFPILTNGAIDGKRRIGSGWDRFTKLVSVGTKLLAMEENGDFYLFDDFDTTDTFWIVNE